MCVALGLGGRVRSDICPAPPYCGPVDIFLGCFREFSGAFGFNWREIAHRQRLGEGERRHGRSGGRLAGCPGVDSTPGFWPLITSAADMERRWGIPMRAARVFDAMVRPEALQPGRRFN